MLERIRPITALVEEMLDQLPKAVFTSKTTTFLDPCMGGGQFVAAIERRLRKHGHSDTNIAKRVYGVENNEFLHDYAVNTHDLVGNYRVEKNYLECEETMKFDVVIGNPPYQRSDSKAKRWTLWEEFLNKSFELSDTVLMIVPQSLTSPGSSWDAIKDNTHVINIDIKDHFMNVGSYFCYFVYDKTRPVKKTKLISSDGIFQKNIKQLPCLPVQINDHTLRLLDALMKRIPRNWKRGELHTSNKSKFSDKGKYAVIHTNAQTLATNIEHENKDKARVVVTLSGYPKFIAIKGKYCSQACVWTEFKTLKEAKAFAKECNEDTIQEIVTTFKWSGWNSKDIISMI